MKVTLYKSSLCPRCHLARRSLEHLRTLQPDIELELVDILTSPRRAIRDGVRMIPAIRIGDRFLSGLFLNRASIAAFLNKARQQHSR